MHFKLALVTGLGVLLWLASVVPGLHTANVAYAEPVGSVDPISGSAAQTYTFAFAGFQPYTQLTLSVLPPNVANFIVINTGAPVITDSEGRAVVRLGMVALMNDPAVLAALPVDAAQAMALLPFVSVTWGNTPGRGIGSVRVDACDTVNCVEFIGTFALPGQ